MSVTMYTTPWCGYCQRLKAQLGRAGVAYTEVDIEQDPAAADLVMHARLRLDRARTAAFMGSRHEGGA